MHIPPDLANGVFRRLISGLLGASTLQLRRFSRKQSFCRWFRPVLCNLPAIAIPNTDCACRVFGAYLLDSVGEPFFASLLAGAHLAFPRWKVYPFEITAQSKKLSLHELDQECKFTCSSVLFRPFRLIEKANCQALFSMHYEYVIPHRSKKRNQSC